jgi:hypothetical protein
MTDASKHRLEFSIKTQWNGQAIDHEDIRLVLLPTDQGLRLDVVGPFFNDPPSPAAEPGKPYQGLWNFEVVEAFFLNDRKQYVEVELCPHGQHLVLLLSDVRKPFKEQLPLNFKAIIEGHKWKGSAVIPWTYFPQGVNRFNAYAIHGSGNRRVYEALYPVPHQQFTEPDFHRLDYFGQVNFDAVWPTSWPHDDDLPQLWPQT